MCVCHVYTNHAMVDNLLPPCHQTHITTMAIVCKSQGHPRHHPYREGTLIIQRIDSCINLNILYVNANESIFFLVTLLIRYPLPCFSIHTLNLLTRCRRSASSTVDFHRKNNPNKCNRKNKNNTKVECVAKKKKIQL